MTERELDLTADPDQSLEQGRATDRRLFGAGLAASVFLHAILAILLFVRIAAPDPVAEPVAIEVELVQPVEPLEDPQEDEQPIDLELPEEAEQDQEEPTVEPEAPELEETPDDALEETVEEESAEEPAALDEDAPSTTDETPADAEVTDDAGGGDTQVSSLPVFQPVFEFAEEESAPPGDEDLPQAEDQAGENTPLIETEEFPPDDGPEGEESTVEESTSEDAEIETADTTNREAADAAPLEEALEEDVAAPDERPTDRETGIADEILDQGVADADQPDGFDTIGQVVDIPIPRPKPQRSTALETPIVDADSAEAPPVARTQPTLTAASRLYSDEILADPRVRTAMGDMRPGQRLNLLCMTELRAQLVTANPPVRPDILPSFRPDDGTVLEPDVAAFRSFGQWFDLAFRCETNAAVTKVETFSLTIGGAIPRDKWRDRGFPLD